MKTFGSVGLEGIKWTVMIRFLEKAQHMNYNFLFLFLNNSFRLPISSKSPPKKIQRFSLDCIRGGHV